MGELIIRSGGNADVKRILRDAKVVAILLRFTNGWWGLYDTDEKRLTPGKLYSTPARAKKAFVSIAAQAHEAGK